MQIFPDTLITNAATMRVFTPTQYLQILLYSDESDHIVSFQPEFLQCTPALHLIKII